MSVLKSPTIFFGSTEGETRSHIVEIHTNDEPTSIFVIANDNSEKHLFLTLSL